LPAPPRERKGNRSDADAPRRPGRTRQGHPGRRRSATSLRDSEKGHPWVDVRSGDPPAVPSRWQPRAGRHVRRPRHRAVECASSRSLTVGGVAFCYVADEARRRPTARFPSGRTDCTTGSAPGGSAGSGRSDRPSCRRTLRAARLAANNHDQDQDPHGDEGDDGEQRGPPRHAPTREPAPTYARR